MHTRQFEYLRDFLMRESGLVVDQSKMYLLRSRLQPLVREFRLKDLNELADAIRCRRNDSLAQAIVEAMTTNETLFFRDGYPFRALRELMLPDCLKHKGLVRIWSAAVSTGQEAWSIAITAAEALPGANFQVRILGTDISESALARAREAVYTQMEINRGMPADLLCKYFDESDRLWRLKPIIRRMVDFHRVNLISSHLVEEVRLYKPFDIVFCRNVLIYFNPEARRDVVDSISRCMRKGGWLVCGATEIPDGRQSRWQPVEFGNRTLWRLASGPS